MKTLLVVALLSIVSWNTAQAQTSDARMAVDRMVAAWNATDLDAIVEHFTEDGVLHSMMAAPVVGREAIRAHLAPLFVGLESLTLELRTVMEHGNTVMIERLDTFVVRGKSGAVPVVGVLEVRDDKIAVWREYFDRSQLFTEMGFEPAAH